MSGNVKISAEHNSNHAYVRIVPEYHGVWVAVGDNETEREVWFSADEAQKIATALVGCASVVNERSESSGVTPERSAQEKSPDPFSHVGSGDDLADAKQANGDTYRRILESWQEHDACLRKISAACWTDNDPYNERDATANIIRHIRALQRRVRQVGSGGQPSKEHADDRPPSQLDPRLTPVHCAECGGWLGNFTFAGKARCWKCAQKPLPAPPEAP